MEIIKKGRIVTCKFCGSVLKYEPEDIKHNSMEFNMGQDYDYIVCPCCDKIVVL